MYKINSSIYSELADRLVADIGDKEFYSGDVVCYRGDVRYHLGLTLIVGRGEATRETHFRRPICRIVPVWWDFDARVGEDLVEDDFDFADLRRAILGDNQTPNP